MRKAILIAMLALPLVAFANCPAGPPFMTGETYGIPSEDFGGTSYLGVDTRDVTSDRLGVLHLKEESGVEVTMVDQDAPAGKAGVKEQDVILTLNGEKVESVEQLRRMIRETPPGRIVSLGISRNGQPMTIKVQLADRKTTYAYSYSYPGSKAKEFHFEMPAMPTMPVMPDIDIPVSIVVVHSSARSGLMVENLTPQLGDFFGAKNGQGVLVRSVEKGSRADKAGFHAGDVIVKINGEPIHDSSDFSHALRGRKDNTASVGIVREKKEQTITITLPERKQSEVFQESLDLPELSAQVQSQLTDFQVQMNKWQPQVQEAVKREMELNTKELCKQKSEIRKQVRDMQRQLRDSQREVERELQQSLHEENEF